MSRATYHGPKRCRHVLGVDYVRQDQLAHQSVLTHAIPAEIRPGSNRSAVH
jgi:hypothetical protein